METDEEVINEVTMTDVMEDDMVDQTMTDSNYLPQYYLFVNHGKLVIRNSGIFPDQPGLFVGQSTYLEAGTIIIIDPRSPEELFPWLTRDSTEVGGFAQCVSEDSMCEGNCMIVRGVCSGHGIVITRNLEPGEELLVSSAAAL